MNGIDQCAYYSKISSVRVSDKLIFSLLPLLICIIADSYPVNLMVIAGMCVCTVRCSNLSLRKYLTLLTIPSTFLVVGTLTIIVNQIVGSHSPALYSISMFGNTYGITQQSLNIGLKLFLKSLASVSCLYFFSLNTTMNSLFTYLRKIKFPTIMIELMELMYRFIFVIWSEANKIYVAQSSRLGYHGFMVSMRSLGALASTVFIKSFHRTDRLNHALEARGFHGSFDGLMMEEKKCNTLKISGFLLSMVLVLVAMMEKVIL